MERGEAGLLRIMQSPLRPAQALRYSVSTMTGLPVR